MFDDDECDEEKENGKYKKKNNLFKKIDADFIFISTGIKRVKIK